MQERVGPSEEKNEFGIMKGSTLSVMILGAKDITAQSLAKAGVKDLADLYVALEFDGQ